MANDDRLTIPTLIHLLLDERDWDETIYTEGIEYKESMFGPTTVLDTQALLDDMKVNDEFKWNVLDMMGKPMEIELDLDNFDLGAIDGLKPMLKGDTGLIGILKNDLADVVEKITGSPIYVSYDGKAIKLEPSNESRGVLDYMSMAWLDSNGLLYAIVALMSVRNVFLILGGWIILLNFVIGMLRGMGKEEKETKITAITKGGSAPAGGNNYTTGPMGGYQFYPGQQTFYAPVYPIGNVDYTPLDMNQISRALAQDVNRSVKVKK